MGSFAVITPSGPANPTGQTPQAAPQGLCLDQVNNLLTTVGSAGTESLPAQRLATILAQAAITAITTAQVLFTKTLNSYLVNRVGRTVRVRGRLVYNSTDSNVATISLILKLGGTTLCTIATTATITTASTNVPVDFEFLLIPVTSGKYAAVISHGKVLAELGTSVATAIATFLDSNVDSSDTVTIGTNPAVGDTVTVNGTVVTFIVNGGTPVGNQVALGTTAAATATALYTFLAASTDTNIAKATWTNPSSTVVLGVSNTVGFVPWVATSVPAKITVSIPIVNLQQSLALAVYMSAGTAAIPSAQLQYATIDVEAV